MHEYKFERKQCSVCFKIPKFVYYYRMRNSMDSKYFCNGHAPQRNVNNVLIEVSNISGVQADDIDEHEEDKSPWQ